MSFKSRISGSKEVPLVSFMDMIFNLLLFFLVTSYIATNSKVEKRFVFPTPKYEIGTAEVFIQWIDEQSVFWIDQNENLESAEDMIGSAAKMIGPNPSWPGVWPQAAGLRRRCAHPRCPRRQGSRGCPCRPPPNRS